MADAIFISYRRDDSEGEAGRLFDDLSRAFGSDAVFMDVTGIKPGVDFRHAIEDNVASCGVFLAIIGPTWANIQGADGKRRLEDPNDFVALEIVSALKREVPVIPVLVHEAKMPVADLLPESLKSFAYHNSVEISHARWGSDVALLIQALKGYVTPRSDSDAPVNATVPAQLPAPHQPIEAVLPASVKNRLPMVGGALAGVFLIVIVFSYFLFRPGPDTGAAIQNVTKAVTTGGTAFAKPATPISQITSAPHAPIAEFVGTWKRAGGAGDSDALGELIISAAGSAFTIQAYGKCQSPTCGWGSQPGSINGPRLVATFSPSPSGSDTSRTATVTAQPTQGGLDVLVHNTFQNPGGSRASNSHHLFTSAQ